MPRVRTSRDAPAMIIFGLFVLLVALGLGAMLGCACPHLTDLAVDYENPYERPIDQISLKSRFDGSIVEANLAEKPDLAPGESGQFFVILETSRYRNFVDFGYDVVNARTR